MKRSRKPLRLTLAIIPITLASACGSGFERAGIKPAICSDTAIARDELNVAVLSDGGDQSVVAADALLRALDEACA